MAKLSESQKFTRGIMSYAACCLSLSGIADTQKNKEMFLDSALTSPAEVGSHSKAPAATLYFDLAANFSPLGKAILSETETYGLATRRVDNSVYLYLAIDPKGICFVTSERSLPSDTFILKGQIHKIGSNLKGLPDYPAAGSNFFEAQFASEGNSWIPLK